MSVRFGSGFTTQIFRTSDLLSYNSNYTFMAWVQFVSFSGFPCVFNLTDDVDDYDFYGADNSTLAFLEQGTAGSATGTDLATDTWYHLTFQRTVNNLKIYIAGVEDTDFGGIVGGGRTAVARMECGAFNSGASNPSDCRIAIARAWTKAITSEAAIDAEAASATAVDTTSLYGDWPFASDLNDISGNTRHWSSSGTLTFQDQPPGFAAGQPTTKRFGGVPYMNVINRHQGGKVW